MNSSIGLKGDFEASMRDIYLRCKEKWRLFLFCLWPLCFCGGVLLYPVIAGEVLWKVQVLESAFFFVFVDEKYYRAGQLVSERAFQKQ